jgi:hypothetical protein
MATVLFRIGVWLMLTAILGAVVRPDTEPEEIRWLWVGASVLICGSALGAIPRPNEM